jgi:hypothetical protein
MKRRRLLQSLGLLAGGSALTVGSGAFTSVQAERKVEIAVADDDDAYLKLDPNDESGQIRSTTSSGELQFYVPGAAPGGPSGDGVNPNSTYVFSPLLEIENQGVDTIEVFSETPDDLPTGLERIALTGPNNAVFDGEQNAITLTPGQRIDSGLLIETSADAVPKSERYEASIRIQADPPGVSDSDEGQFQS